MFRLIILLVALGAGGFAAWLSVRYTQSVPQSAMAAPQVPQAEVLVLAEMLPRGSVVDERSLRWQSLPLEAIPAEAIRRDERPAAIAELAGQVARSDLLMGDALRSASLVEGGAGLMSLVLRPGMRAVGVKISDDKIAGGFILPGDKVDILHTVVRDLDGDGIATGISRTILTNVRVLAIGQTSAQSTIKNASQGNTVAAGSDVTAFGETATVELTPEQAEILTAAQSSGNISLSLRAVSDFGETAVGAEAMVERAASIVEPAPAPGGVDDSPGGTVKMINGGELLLVKVDS